METLIHQSGEPLAYAPATYRPVARAADGDLAGFCDELRQRVDRAEFDGQFAALQSKDRNATREAIARRRATLENALKQALALQSTKDVAVRTRGIGVIRRMIQATELGEQVNPQFEGV